ncbi:envelope glycoprotein H [Cervid alphaherpesvirus 2]|uniref:Envelope glycoprotein H n=1 Tax=Cervid alphaherpesvirus 2 TaxID=365327 RepID=A0A455JL77_9ALPH|nr:envelope glycoprotein H [Cervid alphaherpesvirus 2]AVT50758.1 envelope glycoprotein H [Cervid alphaherpesvirus 2]
MPPPLLLLLLLLGLVPAAVSTVPVAFLLETPAPPAPPPTPAGGEEDAHHGVAEWRMAVGGSGHAFAIRCLGPPGIERVAHIANLSRLLGAYFVVHVDFARSAGLPESMLFLPRAALGNVSEPPAPPSPRAPAVLSLPGILGPAAGWPYLQTRHLVDYDRVPSRPLQDWYFPRAPPPPPRAPARPRGTPAGRTPAFDVNEVLAGGAENFFLPTHLSAARAHYVTDFATVWPLSYVPAGFALAGCRRSALRVTAGVGFLAVSLTSLDLPPLELLVVPAGADVRMITAFNGHGPYPPPGPAPGARRRAFVLGYGSSRLDSPMYSTMRELASYVEEAPGDFRAHLAAAHREALPMLRVAATARRGGAAAAGAPAPGAAYHAYRVAARLGLAIGALSEAAAAEGYALAEELIDVDYHFKLLARALLAAGFGCAPEDSYVRLRALAQLAATRNLRPDAFIPEPAGAALESVAARAGKLRAVYAFAGRDAPPAARRLAHGVVADLYDAFLRGELPWTPPVRRALFFAAAASALPADESALALARDVALRCTAMCTAGHATAAALDLEEAYARVAAAPGARLLRRRRRAAPEDAGGEEEPEDAAYAEGEQQDEARGGGAEGSARADDDGDFDLLDVFSPCMASLRLDLREEAHALDVLSALPARATLDAWLDRRPAAAAANLSEAALGMLGRGGLFGPEHAAALAPELFAAPCGGWGAGARVVAIVPVAPNASYVLSRAHPRRGLTYTLQGVDIANPLLVTFVRGASCVSASAAVETRSLAAPGPLEPCAYCGSVLVRYLPSGAVMDLTLVPDKRAELELARGVNSSVPAFNPRAHSGRSRALLLFPNGTVVGVLAFAGPEALALSPAYVWASAGGALLAGATLFAIAKMLYSSVPIPRGYSAVPAA